MLVSFTATFEVDDDAFEAMKNLEHHADWLLDLESYPEIHTVSNVHVEKIEK